MINVQVPLVFQIVSHAIFISLARLPSRQRPRLRLLGGGLPCAGCHPRHFGPSSEPGGQVARQEDQAAPEAGAQAVSGGCQAGTKKLKYICEIKRKK